MKWLSPCDAEKLLPEYDGEPQAFLFDCAGCDLALSLPVEPRHLSTDDGEPSPTHQWAALIDDRRPVVIQQALRLGRAEPRPLTVLTPYPPPGAAEWSNLRELAVLPEPIQARRPLFIQSRSASRDHVVLRPNERGWSDAVYRAASRPEAEDLLDYLRHDPANGDCFIGSVEPPGYWTVCDANGRGGEILGAYPEVEMALHFASRMSMTPRHEELVVRDASDRRNSNEYRIAHGRLANSRM